MNEKTKKILKVSAIALGEMALLTLGFAVGACSAKAGSKQQTAITTPVAKSLIQRPKKAVTDLTGTKWLLNSSFTTMPYGELFSDENSAEYSFSINYSTNNLSFTNIAFGDEDAGLEGIGTYDYSGGGLNRVRFWRFASGWTDQAYRTISITGGTDATNADLISWLESNATQIGGETPPSSSESSSSEPVTSQPETSQPESSYSIPDPIPLPDTLEKIVLNASYDFRRWFGNVDPTTGAIQFKLPTGISLYSVRVGGLEWENLGNERTYNCIEFTLQPFNASNALVVSDGLAKTAQQLYGDKYTEFCMLSGVYYSYQSGYDGTYTVIQDSALPSVDYRDRIYSMPMVSAQLDGTTENINALDIRNCVIPSVYRTFGISQDDGVVFSTNGYSSVTTRQLLGMDFSSVVNYSEGTASAFSLLTQAFGSVAGLLAVQVLPNITLGLLLFLPLIGAVIVLVIKAVKK